MPDMGRRAFITLLGGSVAMGQAEYWAQAPLRIGAVGPPLVQRLGELVWNRATGRDRISLGGGT
jgi:hypothetical protein